MFLKEEIAQIETFLPHFEKYSETISKKTVGWQIDHTLRVLIGVPRVLEKSDPKDFKRNFNKVRSFVFLFNKIPRGKGKAPKKVVNEQPITLEGLKNLIDLAKNELQKVNGMHPRANFQHQYFGLLNLKQTKKFLKIHTRHHLKIVDDIVNSN